MREILFKGKRLDNGEWIEGGYFKWVNLIGEDQPMILVKTESGFSYNQVLPETVCQFTGLTDKNGVKIFENDIIRDCNEDNEVFTVKYYAHRGYPAFDCEPEMHCDCNGLSYLMETGELAVIGNIFDNPELMEGGGSDE